MLHFWKSSHGNFGDDLNNWIWDDFINPALVSPDNHSIALIGIGTILDRAIPAHGLRVVLGSGAGYADPPDFGTGAWRVEFVRGPLTELLIGHPGTAITDPAILVAHYFPQIPVADRQGTVFVPHFKAVKGSAWPLACARAGVEYLDPSGESHTIVARIASAQLVLAESMHAAIVADAMRVPWIPITTSPEISSFKWSDFSLSMELPYRPVSLPASNFFEVVLNHLIKNSSENLSEQSLFEKSGIFTEEKSENREMNLFHIILKRQQARLPQAFSQAARIWRRGMGSSLFTGVQRASARRLHACAAILASLTMDQAILSDLSVHQNRLAGVKQALAPYRSMTGA